jgi:hypothetical protein
MVNTCWRLDCRYLAALISEAVNVKANAKREAFETSNRVEEVIMCADKGC